MTDTTTSLSNFFAAWGDDSAEGRAALVAPAIGDTFHYADPHSPAPITSAGDFLDFVAGFAKSAPGARAEVVGPADSHNGHFRCTVRFVMGPDKAMTGQYFGDLDDAGKITRIVGFVGKGAE